MKDYKKILEGVVNIINTTEKSDIGFANICTYIGENCPELKESEDERIRKELIDFVKSRLAGFPQCENFIAWLEKQGETFTKKDVDDAYLKGISNAKQELEKQSEQKLTVPKWRYKNDNTPLLRDSLILNKYGCVGKSPSGALVNDVWVMDYGELAKLPKEELEKQGKQKPLFKKGDTVFWDGEEFNILDVTKDSYNVGGYIIPICRQNELLLKQKPAWSEMAKWQKEHLWKPADGNDLPEIDREVIAILNNGKVVFAHRHPEYWDGKNIITGKVTRNYPKTYDKGGWNIPDVKYWLDYDINELLCREK